MRKQVGVLIRSGRAADVGRRLLFAVCSTFLVVVEAHGVPMLSLRGGGRGGGTEAAIAAASESQRRVVEILGALSRGEYGKAQAKCLADDLSEAELAVCAGVLPTTLSWPMLLEMCSSRDASLVAGATSLTARLCAAVKTLPNVAEMDDDELKGILSQALSEAL